MLSNQISTKDLFGFPMRHSGRDLNDSALTCSQGNSQFLNSQVEYSQLSFQDSQLPESQSQSDSDGRRMYQKYMSKGPLFKPDGGFSANNPHSTQAKASHQQFIQSQKARARERDERDLLRSIMSIVNDSSGEVRLALQSFRDSIESKQGNTEENLSSSFKKLSEDLKKSCDKVIDSVAERDSLKDELHCLEKEISKRDAVISGLEKQLKEYQQRDEHRILDLLKDCHLQQQDVLEEKLQKLLNVTTEQLKLYDKQACWQSDQESEQKGLQREMFKEQQSHLKCLEDKLLTEMSNLQHDFEDKQTWLGNYYKQQLQESHRQHAKTVDTCVQQSLVDGLRQASRDTCSMFSQQRQEIDSTCSRHREELEQFLKAQLSKQLAEYDHKINQVVESLKTSEASDKEISAVTKTSEINSAAGNNYSKGMWVTLPLRSPKPAYQNHLESGNKNGYRCDFESITIKSPDFNLTSSYSRSTLPPATGSLFGSPWNSKTLFGKSQAVKPSPVATVPPMVQRKPLNNNLESADSLKVPITEGLVPPKQRPKRQKGIVQPQRRSQRLNKDQSDSFEHVTEVGNHQDDQPVCSKPIIRNYQTCGSKYAEEDKGRQTSALNHGSIYDFRDDRPLKESNMCKDQLKRKSRPWASSEPEWLKVARFQNNTPAQADHVESSSESSPSVSMMEVVVKRRVKRDRTPQITCGYSQHTQWSNPNKTVSGESRDKQAFDDLLSTPCFRPYDGLAESSHSHDPIVWEGKMSRKETGKRKLCDVNYDTQITEITKSIRRHMQRVKPRS